MMDLCCSLPHNRASDCVLTHGLVDRSDPDKFKSKVNILYFVTSRLIP